jgi:hypothetical protein
MRSLEFLDIIMYRIILSASSIVYDLSTNFQSEDIQSLLAFLEFIIMLGWRG